MFQKLKNQMLDWLSRLNGKMVRQCAACGYVWDLTSVRRCPNCKSTNTILVDQDL